MMSTMEQEVPLIVYTKQLNSVIDISAGCNTFYVKTFGFPQDMADNLCSGGILEVDTFTFKDQEKTSRAWTNIILNNNTANPSDYADLVFLSSKTAADLDTLIFYSTSKLQNFLTKNVFQPIFVKYPNTCKLNAANTICTNKELTYQQWLD